MEIMSLAWGRRSSRLLLAVVGIVLFLLVVAISTPNQLRSRMAPPSVGLASRGSLAKIQLAQSVGKVAPVAEPFDAMAIDRKVVRNGTLALIVDNPVNALDAINSVAHRYQGYVVSSELTGSQQSQCGNITIRVPAAQFDAARSELKKLAKQVDSEQTTSDDVTMQLAENEATLRNFRAEEASYLEIMKRAGKIPETLEVAQQLSNVRGRIERLEAQIRTMSMQTDMAAIVVTVSMEPIVVAPQRWRPLYELSAAWSDGVEALTRYLTAMIAFIMYLPAVLAWIATILLSARLALALFRAGYRIFVPKSPVTAA